jgi:hypothetical protein
VKRAIVPVAMCAERECMPETTQPCSVRTAQPECRGELSEPLTSQTRYDSAPTLPRSNVPRAHVSSMQRHHLRSAAGRRHGEPRRRSLAFASDAARRAGHAGCLQARHSFPRFSGGRRSGRNLLSRSWRGGHNRGPASRLNNLRPARPFPMRESSRPSPCKR